MVPDVFSRDDLGKSLKTLSPKIQQSVFSFAFSTATASRGLNLR